MPTQKNSPLSSAAWNNQFGDSDHEFVKQDGFFPDREEL